MGFILNKETGKLLEEKSNDYCVWYEKVDIPSGEPTAVWKGKKIPMEVLAPMLEFFRKFGVDHEVQASIYHNVDTHEWKVWVWPQEWGTGMSTSTIADDKRRDKQWAKHFGPGWEKAASAHTHCRASAFQSGTDEKDEKNQIGLHLTFGKMHLPVLDFHARYIGSNGGLFNNIDPNSFFELPKIIVPENIDCSLAISAVDVICSMRMKKPEWPAEWESNLVVSKPKLQPKWKQNWYTSFSSNLSDGSYYANDSRANRSKSADQASTTPGNYAEDFTSRLLFKATPGVVSPFNTAMVSISEAYEFEPEEADNE